jgi:hypothetical protein
MDCVSVNAEDPQVAKLYTGEVNTLWDLFQVPYCDVARSIFGDCDPCHSIASKLRRLTDCNTRESCKPACAVSLVIGTDIDFPARTLGRAP